jgi:ATP-dependent DNA helicase RecG
MSPKDTIVAMIQENPKVTIAKMAEHLDIDVRAVKKHIAALEEAKIIDRFGSPRTGHWVILESADKNSME